MANGDCEKIIEQVTDPKNLNDQCRQHIKVCKECAAIVACMTWVKTKGSPTSSMQPSQAFLNRIDQSLSSSPTGGGASLAGGNKLLAWGLGIALAASVALGAIAIFNNNSNPAATSEGITTSKTANSAGSAAKAESQILNTQQTAPVLKFPSPADDAE